MHHLPLLSLHRQVSPAAFGNPVVLAPTALIGLAPTRRDMSLALEPVQDGIEHAVGPLQMPAGQLGDALDDRVAIAVTVGKNGEDEGRRGGGY